MVSAEALVRWQHPDIGLLEPARFIPMAEKMGFITAIDKWTLRSACTQIKEWMDAGISPDCVTVNLSARQFQRQDIAEKVDAILKETGLPAEHLD
jgi:EAL domain-containing protein (putative c-di-GMP-specific phosphodiesterase class I)